MAKEIVRIFDTTMRDGDQAAGVSMTIQDKVTLAKRLERLNVDVIEAGFPISSRVDMEAVSAVARQVRKPVVCALARAKPQDIDTAWEAIQAAKNPRIHVFISSSDIHIVSQLKKGKDEVVKMAVDAVSRAKNYTNDVEFSAMDATRTEHKFLYKLLEAAIQAGATTINIPDTVGYAIPDEFANLISNILNDGNVRGVEKVVVSVHCHNDLGMATANSLSAVKKGARQVEVCINGIGERAGNASLEEVVMAIHTRSDYLDLTTSINTKEIYLASRLVKNITGIPIQPNKAIVGENAFRHQSGIHQDGLVKNRNTYEIIDPRDVGFPSDKLQLVIGKNSGRAGIQEFLKNNGYKLSDEMFNRVAEVIKEAAGKGTDITPRFLSKLIKHLTNK